MFNNLLVATVQGCTGYVTRCKSDAKLAVRLSTPCFRPNIGNTTILVSQQYCIPIILILQQYYCSSNLDIWIWYEQIFISGNIPIYFNKYWNIIEHQNIRRKLLCYCIAVQCVQKNSCSVSSFYKIKDETWANGVTIRSSACLKIALFRQFIVTLWICFTLLNCSFHRSTY